MIDDKEKEMLEDAISTLNDVASRDHCGERTCTVETPDCEVMYARAAVAKIESVIDPVMKSMRPERLKNNAEMVYFEAWMEANKRLSFLNSGYTSLEWILCPSNQKYPSRPSQRDADVATAVIQWLGTSCGLGFIRECERRIEQQRAEFSEMGMQMVFVPMRERDLFDKILDKVLNRNLPKLRDANDVTKIGKYTLASLRNDIAQMMNFAFSLYAAETGIASGVHAAASAGMTLDRFKRLQDQGRRAVTQRVAKLQKRLEKQIKEKTA